MKDSQDTVEFKDGKLNFPHDNCYIGMAFNSGSLVLSILIDIFPAYQEGMEHDVLEFLLSAFDCIDREQKEYVMYLLYAL